MSALSTLKRELSDLKKTLDSQQPKPELIEVHPLDLAVVSRLRAIQKREGDAVSNTHS